MVKKHRGNRLVNSKRDDTRFQVGRPPAEAASLLETVLRCSLGQSPSTFILRECISLSLESPEACATIDE